MRPKPTRDAVEEMLNDFEAHGLIGSRRDVYELVVSVFRDWLTQEEELSAVELEKHTMCKAWEKQNKIIEQLQVENHDLKTKGEQLCCRVGVLEMENQALKAFIGNMHVSIATPFFDSKLNRED